MIQVELLPGNTVSKLEEFLSRSNTLLRVSLSSLQGSLSKKVSRITRGAGLSGSA